LSETMSQLASSLSLASSGATAASGQPVTFTVTVSGADGGTPTGTVTFLDGSTVLGSATLDATASGEQAVFTISTLANGTHSITAAYGGDSAYTASSSSAMSQSVQQMSGTVSLFASDVLINPGLPVTFTATVTGADGGTPSGTVTFLDGSTVL